MSEKTFKPEDVGSDDPHIRELVAECMNTGKPIEGFVDEHGHFHMKKILTPKEQEARSCGLFNKLCNLFRRR